MHSCRVLFVDDDAFVLRSLRRTMRRAPNWTSEFVSNPEHALDQIGREQFDIVVSDYSMPQMTGMDFLSEVQRVSPDTVRVIMTGGAAGDISSSIVHQKWAKPWIGADLISNLDRIVSLRKQLRNPKILKHVGEVDKLPSPPAVVSEIQEQLANPESTAQSIANVIANDPAMGAKLLQLCNSAFVGLNREVHSIHQGVVLLGKRAIGNLVMAEAIYASFEAGEKALEPSIATLRQEALMRAHIACELFTNPAQRDDAFAAGLLADTGLLVLASTCPEFLSSLFATARQRGDPIQEVIRSEIGACHSVFGAYLLAMWGIPSPIVDGVFYQFVPKPPLDREIDAAESVYLGHQLVLEYQSMGPPLTDSSHVQSLGLTSEVARWRTSTQRILDAEQPRRMFRHQVSWEASFRAPSSEGTGQILDASVDGVFLSAADLENRDIPVGSEIHLCAKGTASRRIEMKGVVRWVGRSVRHDRKGLGIQLTEPDGGIETLLLYH